MFSAYVGPVLIKLSNILVAWEYIKRLTVFLDVLVNSKPGYNPVESNP